MFVPNRWQQSITDNGRTRLSHYTLCLCMEWLIIGYYAFGNLHLFILEMFLFHISMKYTWCLTPLYSLMLLMCWKSIWKLHEGTYQVLVRKLHIFMYICCIYSLREQFRHLLKGVQHERPDVRLHALKALHKLLKSNRVRILLNAAKLVQTVCKCNPSTLETQRLS